ncbi:MAG: anthranilate 1,2-dioxygenase large subunit [Gammaproteobacteria bacterium]|jgi:anthranilate 1,2-dioxygenase large subunit
MSVVSDSSKIEMHWPEDQEACHVPYQVFTDQNIYDLEQQRIFRGDNWSFVGLAAEIPKGGDFKATYIGDTPVIVTRDQDGKIHVMPNRCSHRGALVCRSLRGNANDLECVYHQWKYDLKGNLIGLPFRRGLGGRGGMPEGFKMEEHGLDKLRVGTVGDLIFATFSHEVEDLHAYLGPVMVTEIERIFHSPIRILGDERQLINGNWKLYAENTRDPYHASLLHMFHTTFGMYRSTQKGGTWMDAQKRHNVLMASKGTDEGKTEEYDGLRTFNTEFTLQDPSLLTGRKEFEDGVTLVILTTFPNMVLQQIANTLAVRHTVTKGPKQFELVWTQFGYEDDDEEMQNIRNKQGNLIGPAGLVSMEDGEAVEIVHQAVIRDQDKASYIAMGGNKAEDAEHLVTEAGIIGFWEYYRKTMQFEASR